jgi:N6-adenosine-specific RNA methylase IME4
VERHGEQLPESLVCYQLSRLLDYGMRGDLQRFDNQHPGSKQYPYIYLVDSRHNRTSLLYFVQIGQFIALSVQCALRRVMEKFNIVYADPAWRYDNNGGQGVAENHYPTMNISDICALPVADIAAKDSVLFLWATFPMLPESLRVIEAWGFKFKTVAFVWLKQNKISPSWFYGMGYWTRSNAEICLLATRGKPKRQNNSIHQLIISPREAHSKKPDEARDKIVRLMGDVPRVELFARQATPGWAVWGNEVSSDITLRR